MISNEADILKQEVRSLIIQEIDGPENRARKDEAYKRYKCYKDQTHLFTLDHLLAQFDEDTVQEMQYALSNISITKKIVNKLARVYSNGVKREAGKKTETKNVEALEKLLKLNQTFKKLNRFLRLQKNVLLYIKPVRCDDGKYRLKLVPLQPYFYDVVESPDDPEKPIAIILSHYSPKNFRYTELDPGKRSASSGTRAPHHDGKNQTIADRAEDSPPDADLQDGKIIWWTKSYHFTTDKKGTIITPVVESGLDGDPLANPINELPFEVLAEDQDNAFWAEGGDDIIDGAIRINAQLTNLIHIGVTQGYGQLVLTGTKLPTSIKVGPNHAIRLETAEGSGDALSDAKFINAASPIQELKDLIVMKIALLLSTNNLSTKSIAADLSSSADFPSAIAMIVDMAESTEDVEDQAQVFMDAEPAVWRKIAKWMSVYDSRELLDEKLKKHLIPDTIEVTPNFEDAKPIMSEKEELEILKMRKELGLDRMVDLIMRDNPGLTEDQANEKLNQILDEQMERAAKNAMAMGEEGEPGEGDQDDGNGPGDKRPDRDPGVKRPAAPGSKPPQA